MIKGIIIVAIILFVCLFVITVKLLNPNGYNKNTHMKEGFKCQADNTDEAQKVLGEYYGSQCPRNRTFPNYENHVLYPPANENYSFTTKDGEYSPWEYSSKKAPRDIATRFMTGNRNGGISSQASKEGIGRNFYKTMEDLPNSFEDPPINLCPGQIVVCLIGNRYEYPPLLYTANGDELKPTTYYDVAKKLKYTYVFCGVDPSTFNSFYVQTSSFLPFMIMYQDQTGIGKKFDIVKIDCRKPEEIIAFDNFKHGDITLWRADLSK